MVGSQCGVYDSIVFLNKCLEATIIYCFQKIGAERCQMIKFEYTLVTVHKNVIVI